MRLVPLARLHFLHVYSNSPELFTDLQAVTCAVPERADLYNEPTPPSTERIWRFYDRLSEGLRW